VVALAWLLALGTAGAAEPPRFAAGTQRVLVSATAVDGRGRPVRNLTARDLRIYENGKLQTLTHFSSAGSGTARLLVLADQSGSMGSRERSASARMALLQVLAGLAPADEVGLAGFDQDYRLLLPFTRDRRAVVATLDRMEPFGATALHDALAHASADAAVAGEGRPAILVLTDGVDTASSLTAAEALARAQAVEVPIYAISVVAPIDDPESGAYAGATVAAQGRAVLARYAAASGGAAFVVSDLGALQKATTRLLEEVRQQYRLGYDPPPGPPGHRRVEVRATRKGVTVRTRSGYVARP
jgi:Ca-activated chloride channel homolog